MDDQQQSPEGVSHEEPVEVKTPLTYEETPIIEPVGETVSPKTLVKKKTTIGSVLKVIMLFAVLFFVGFWVSGMVRQYINTPLQKTETTPTPTIAAVAQTETTPSGTLDGVKAGWKEYQVLVASTRKPYEGVTFQLPGDVVGPVCDGTSCASQGTYLPGGTRFTVALRGKGQALPDYRGKMISDVGGQTFTVKETTVSGQMATEFTGSFTGGTVGGYAFSAMHGYMIDVGDGVSLEMNHFSPSGIKADFASDDTLFQEIVSTVKRTTVSLPTMTPAPTKQASAAASSPSDICTKEGTTAQMTYLDAVAIASKSDCVTQGKLKSTHMCNTTTGTWWIDLDVTKTGCAPACVVDVVTKTATVNWRCTGLSQ